MARLPEREQQVATLHAAFIRRVVELAQQPAAGQELANLLKAAEDNGWIDLVGALRRILSGNRDTLVLEGLDEEDRVIAGAVLRGLQNPATLPDPAARPDPALAAPGLAGMIKAAARGNAAALQIISEMAEQMSRAGGQMARVASVVRPLINGERDPQTLCKGLDARSRQLVMDILNELAKSDLH